MNTFFLNLTPKPIPYLFAYLWFPIFIFSLSYLSSNITLDYRIILSILTIGFSISLVYNFLEIIDLISNSNIFSLPRYDREVYKFYSPIGFRVRGFNYESGNYGFYINVCFIFIYSNIRSFKLRLIVIIMAAVALLLSFSSFHLVVFLLFIIPYLYFYEKKKLKLSFFYFILAFVFMTIIYVTNNFNIVLDGFDLILSKFNSYVTGSGSESGEVRNLLLMNAINQIDLYPIFGEGLSSFYYYQESGYNNIYLQVFQQLGFFGGVIFFSVVIYPCIIYILNNRKLDYKVVIFFVSMLSMWFIGDFWVPQLFIFYLIIANKKTVLIKG
tara:strand:+ start:1768 stop:2745 length:978 start_codon:yes stop_codon:yes gene_type:complete